MPVSAHVLFIASESLNPVSGLNTHSVVLRQMLLRFHHVRVMHRPGATLIRDKHDKLDAKRWPAWQLRNAGPYSPEAAFELISTMPKPGIVFMASSGSHDSLLMEHAHAHGVQVVLDMKHARPSDLTPSWLESATRTGLRAAASGTISKRLATHGVPVLDLSLATDETRFLPVELKEEGGHFGWYGSPAEGGQPVILAMRGVDKTEAAVVASQCPQTTVSHFDFSWDGAGRGSELEAMSPAAATVLGSASMLLVDGTSPHASTYVGIAAFQGKAAIVVHAREELQELPNVHAAKNWVEAGALACMDIGVRNRRRLWEVLVRHSASGAVDRLLGPIPIGYSISIIVALHNNAALVERVARSLVLHTQGLSSKTEIILVDGDSQDDSAEALKQAAASGVRVVHSSKGSAPAVRNAGLRAMTKPSDSTKHLVAFLDSDMIVSSSSWLQEAAAILRADLEVGAVGWAAGWFDPATRKETEPCYYVAVRGANEETEMAGYRKSVAYLGSGGMVVRFSALLDTNGFDEEYAPAGYEDTDMSFAIRTAGYALAYRFTTGILHEAHASTSRFESEGIHYDTILGRNSIYFQDKWKDHDSLFSPYSGNAASPQHCRRCRKRDDSFADSRW